MKEKKYLWCKKCKKFPDKIIERYLGDIEEERKWDGDCYELTGSNMDTLEVESLCGKCKTKLVEK